MSGKRKHKHEEHENHERWLVSYADFITLLFAFFTVLYASSQTDKEKLKAVINGMNAAFDGGLPHSVLDTLSFGTTDSPLAPTHVSTEASAFVVVENLRQNLSGSLSDNTIQIGLIDQTLQIDLPQRLTFAPGSAELNPGAFSVLSAVAEAVKDAPATIEVVGRADVAALPPNSQYADNWSLASARSLAAVRYLESHDVPVNNLISTATMRTEIAAEKRAVTLRIKAHTVASSGEVLERLDNPANRGR